MIGGMATPMASMAAQMASMAESMGTMAERSAMAEATMKENSTFGVSLTEGSIRSDKMDEDLAVLLNLGVKVDDVARLWANIPGFDLAALQASAERILMGTAAEGALELDRMRRDSLAVELLQRTSNSQVIDDVARRLREELDEPPEQFKDPIMFTLMAEPVVLSSGHVFDRSTVYDESGDLRFERCPISRKPVEWQAYPLCFLKVHR